MSTHRGWPTFGRGSAALLIVVIAASAPLGAMEPQTPSPAAALAQQNQASSSAPDADLNPRVYLTEPDGSNRKLLLDLPDYDIQGTPSWSND